MVKSALREPPIRALIILTATVMKNLIPKLQVPAVQTTVIQTTIRLRKTIRLPKTMLIVKIGTIQLLTLPILQNLALTNLKKNSDLAKKILAKISTPRALNHNTSCWVASPILSLPLMTRAVTWLTSAKIQAVQNS